MNPKPPSNLVLRCPAPLDPDFQPAALVSRQYHAAVSHGQERTHLALALERLNGITSRLDLDVAGARATTLRYVERLVKFLLWSRGGYRLHVGGADWLGAELRERYAPGGARAFDVDLMSRVYGQPFEVVVGPVAAVPESREAQARVGGHLDGCRIGFDLGASDYKVAAVKEGEAVFTAELPWDPKNEADPRYHYTKLQEGLRLAAAHLPRVDAIGGSSAGVFLDNEPRAGSLFRSVPPAEFAQQVKPMFKRLAAEWAVPVTVINDGEVTALAGAMSLGVNGILGVAMGSSQAGGYLTPAGRLTDWLNELAFAPVDFNPGAPADEWSGDRGVGALYFSQQAVNKLLPAAGIALPDALGLPERLKEVQALMAKADPRAERIYRTIGVYLGYAIPFYAEFYEFSHMLILGRVTTGAGGDVVLGQARAVLQAEFPDLAERIALHVPDEQSRRVGQAVAAASLPELRPQG